MKKIISLACGLASLASGAMAESQNKFSMGLQGGYLNQSGHFDLHNQRNTSKTNTDMGSKGGTVGLLIGYDRLIMSKAMLGVELFGSFQDTKAEHKTSNVAGDFNSHIKMKESYGAALRMGYVMGPMMPYLKAGYVNTKFESHLDNETLNKEATTSQRKGGMLAAIGFDYKLCGQFKNWSVGGEYSYTWYRNINVSLPNGSYTQDYKPKVNAVNLRLKYSF